MITIIIHDKYMIIIIIIIHEHGRKRLREPHHIVCNLCLMGANAPRVLINQVGLSQ